MTSFEFETFYDMLKNVLPQTEDEWKEVAYLFQRKWNFFPVCGAMDGKHINIKKPPGSGSEFFNYKKCFTIVLFALVDAQYCFQYVNFGAVRSAGDAGIFRASTLCSLGTEPFESSPRVCNIGRRRIPIKPVPHETLSKKKFSS